MADVPALVRRYRVKIAAQAMRRSNRELSHDERDLIAAADALEQMYAALREADDFLQHSGNQRAILSGKFTTPSARYDWFVRVRDSVRALVTPPNSQPVQAKEK